MAVAVGQRCVARIKIADIDLRKAKDIMATIVSPQGEEKCQDVSFDEISGFVYVTVDLRSVGAWSMWLGVRFTNEAVYTPAFVFAEVEGETKPCDAPYIVDVQVSGESVTVTPPKIDVDAVTQEEFDALASKVESKVDKVEGKGLSTNDFTDEYKQKVEEFIIDTELSPTSDNAIANSAVVQGLAGLAEGVSEAIGNVAKNVEQNTADIKTKQDTLTLTTKPNGNIVIGNLAGQTKEFMPATPSGDPMHYAYLRGYPTGSNTPKGLQYNEDTDRWSYMAEYGGLTDLTSGEVGQIFAEGGSGGNTPDDATGKWSYVQSRTNFINVNVPMDWGYVSSNYTYAFLSAAKLEVGVVSPTAGRALLVGKAAGMFMLCRKMRRVIGVLDLRLCSTVGDMFRNCDVLEDVSIANIKLNMSFSDSPLLSKESLLYMISNCASNVSFTITLHPNVYAKCTRVDEGEGQYEGEWWAEIDEALGYAVESKDTNITLASA